MVHNKSYLKASMVIILSLALLLSACACGNEEKTEEASGVTLSTSSLTGIDSERPSEPLPSSWTETETVAPSPVLDQTIQEQSLYNINKNMLRQLPEPVVQVKECSSLPDTLGKAKGRTEDKREGNSYYIAALDLTLTIPQGYYFYRVDGLYRDSENNPVRLEFVDEYILSLRDLPEEELVREIYQYTDIFDAEPGIYTPLWVLWNFKLVHKDYLPLEQLFASRIRENGDIRQTGDYYVVEGTARNWSPWGDPVESHDRFAWLSPECMALEEERTAGKLSDEQYEQALLTRYDWPLIMRGEDRCVEDLQEAIRAVSIGSGIWYEAVDYSDGYHTAPMLFYNDLHPAWVWPACPDSSFLSDSWWEAYRWALRELDENTGKYEYPGITIHFVSSEDQGQPDTEEQLSQREGWYQDTTADRTPRACVYAWLKTTGQEVALEDIAIYLKPSQNEANLFLAFSMDRLNGYQLSPIMKGVDYFSLSNLEIVREYSMEWLR